MNPRLKVLVTAVAAGVIGGAGYVRADGPSVGTASGRSSDAAVALQSTAPSTAANDRHACKGINECKGKGGCKTEKNECAGKNACKGLGGCASAEAKHDCKGKNECKALGGCKTDKNACAGKNACKGQGGCKVPHGGDEHAPGASPSPGHDGHGHGSDDGHGHGSKDGHGH